MYSQANFKIFELKNNSSNPLENKKYYSIKDLETYFSENEFSQKQDQIQGYLVKSTAPLNVDGKIENISWSETRSKIIKIAHDFIAKSAGKDLDLTFFVHGYAVSEKDMIERCEKIYEYASQEYGTGSNKKLFLGYRWTSENITLGDSSNSWLNVFNNLRHACQALPNLLKFIAWFSIGILSSYFILILFNIISSSSILSISVGTFILSIFLPIVLTLAGLRLATYFRDRDRASNYAVFDLVDFLRKLDLAIFNEYLIQLIENDAEIRSKINQDDIKEKIEYYRYKEKEKLNLVDNLGIDVEDIKNQIIQKIQAESKRVKLSFIAHSMGAFVVTNVIRILSDVFDSNSIDKNPSSHIGKTFTLGRMVLLAPDIPVETIIDRRANFLAPSLRRCQETYIFSSEGDLALRLASTAANYFSFPAQSRVSGYRLGNITVKHFAKKGSKILNTLHKQPGDAKYSRKYSPKYGIIDARPLESLEVRSSDQDHTNFQEVPFSLNTQQDQTESLANQRVSYFDCTDYIDTTGKPNKGWDDNSSRNGILTYALRKPALNTLFDYCFLILAYLRGKINTHGGYFEGKFIQALIYDLAFLGIDKVEDRLDAQNTILTRDKFSKLSDYCEHYQIQVILAKEIAGKANPNQSFQSFTFSK